MIFNSKNRVQLRNIKCLQVNVNVIYGYICKHLHNV